MCFNAETSIGAFTFGILCSAYIIKRGFDLNNNDDKIMGIILILVSLVQLIEYFLWKYPDCGNINQIFTIMIIFVLFLQPIGIYFLNKYYYKELNNYIILYIPVILFLLVTIMILIELIKNKKKLCSKKDKNSCRLVWGSLRYLGDNKLFLLLCFSILYFFIMIIPRLIINKKLFISDKPIKYNIVIILTIFALLISTYYKGEKFYEIFGSLWCFLALSYGLFGVLNI